jgi:hypothetical protein
MRLTPAVVFATLLLLLLAAPAPGHENDRSEVGALTERFGQPDLARRAGDGVAPVARAAQFTAPPATPKATCGPGSDPEPGLQGRSAPDAPGRADGFRCNTTLAGRFESAGGYKALRYVDKAGRECAYYDTTLLFPTNAVNLSQTPTGVAVLDMSDPTKPRRTASLLTPAMQTPHESVVVNEKRGLIAAVAGNPAFAPGIVDIYDISEDCRNPVLQSSSPFGYIGHESGFSPDGNTFFATSIGTGDVTALDVSDPKLPKVVWRGKYESHGLTVSDDGNRAYLADSSGLIILDISQIQARAADPQVREVSRLSWPTITIPQVAHPVTIGGKPYIVEVDEFSATESGSTTAHGIRVGAGRIIDISDETKPRVVSNLRLEVNQPEHRDATKDDPGTTSPVQGYAGHYCNIPQRKDPGIVACSFIASGLRVFDIRDPEKPREIAYYQAPPSTGASPTEPSNYAMSSPSFVPERGEIWYTDGGSGFYNVRVAPGVWPFRAGSAPGATDPSLGLPSNRRCVSRRNFPLTMRGITRNRVRSLTVYVDGKRRAVRRGRTLRAPVDLRGLPKGTVRVRVVALTRSGKRIVDERRYRTCVPRRASR